jgi:hypothetical protein
MEKLKGLIIVLFLIPSFVCAANEAKPSAVTFTASLTASAVTITAASALTYTPQLQGPIDITKFLGLVDSDEDIINLKVKELHLNITPAFRVVLPDASINLGLNQKIGDTILEGMTEYNYLQNSISYMLKYGLETYVPVSVSLYDNLNFEQIYKSQKYIQRTRGLGFNLGSPLILSCIKIGEEFKNETSYLAKLDGEYLPDEGIASLLTTWVELKLKDKKAGSEYDSFRLYVDLEKAIPHAYSRYNFVFMNVSVLKNFRSDRGNNLMLYAGGGYMYYSPIVPLWKLYSLGGYDGLIGYGLNEFQEYYKVFSRIKYDRTIASNINWQWLWFTLDNVRAFVIGDAGSVSNLRGIQCIDTYKCGVGLGTTIQFTFRKRTAVKVTFALGQAIAKNRVPVFYFIYELP